MSSHKAGVLLVTISAIVFSSAGVFTKAVESDAWEIIFWRGVFAAGFTCAYVLWQKRFAREFLCMSGSGLAVAIVGASGIVAFIPAFKLTSMANVMLIYAAAPLIAAVLAWIWINERLTRRLVLGCTGSIAGVAIIVSGSANSINLQGDLLALWMTIAMAILMVIYRRYPSTPAAGPAALSSLILLPIAIYHVNPFIVSMTDFLLMAAFGLAFAIASVTLAEGVKRLPAGETALLSTLETPLAPLLGWLFFAEIPADATVFGGIIVVVAVLSTRLDAKGNTERGTSAA